MAVIREYLNPFLPGQPAVEHQHEGGITVWEWLRIRQPGFVNFTVPTVCSVVVPCGQEKSLNYLLPEDWNSYVIQPDDIVTFTAIPGDPVSIFIAILVVLVIASIVLILTMPKPTLPGQQKQPNSIYNLEGRQNENKYGQPIPDNYGRLRHYPAYGAGSYNEFDVNGNQLLYVVLCLGHGEYEIETEEIDGEDVPTWRFGDTNIVSFEGIEVQNCPPGTPVTLFPDNVITIANIQSVELYGPNQTDPGEYVYDDEGTETGTLFGTRIGIDIVFPNGLYASDTQGNFLSNTIQALWEYSTNEGETWSHLFSFDRTMATNDPQRFTVNTTVPLGVTHVRANRINDRDLNARSGNTILWQAFRIFLPSTVDYGNVHMVAFKALATNNLNTQSQATFNFVATRKLPIYDFDYKTWSAPVATRSIAWAFAAVAKASYGGRMTDDKIDLDGLVAIDEDDIALGNKFDGQFTQRTGLWDGPLKAIAAVWRGRPMMVGRKLTIVRDGPITIPSTFYNTATIVKDSADLAIQTPEIDPIDGVEITYTDETTLKEETVLCYLNGDAYPQNPERVTLFGVTVRRQAYQEGMIQYARRRYQRMNLSIKVGMEGQLASYGSMVGICRDKPRWGAGGRVESIEFGTPSVVTLNEPCRFGTNAIAVGTITTTGNATVTVTFGGDDIVLVVPVVEDDTPGMWASRVRKAMQAETDITDAYEVYGTGDRISLKPKAGTAYDATLNVAIENDGAALVSDGAIEADDNIYTNTAHGFVTGDDVKLVSMTGGTGLSPGVVYYFIRLTDNTGKFAETRTLAALGTAIDVTLDASSVILKRAPTAGITEVVESDKNHVIAFKTYNGDMMPPLAALPVEDNEYQVTVAGLTDDDNATTGIDNIPLDDIHEKAPFVFGINDFWVKKMIVVGMTPSGKEEVELNLVNYAPEIFAADDEDDYPVPELPDTSEVPLNPALPSVTGVKVAGVPGQLTQAIVSWRAALGARNYITETQVVADVGAELTALAATDVLTKTSHGFIAGDLILVAFDAGFGNLVSLRAYYCIFINADDFKLATSAANATAGIAIGISSDGADGTAIRITDGWKPWPSTTGLSWTIPVSPTFLIARVAGVNTGQGRWSYWQGEVGVAEAAPNAVQGLVLQSPFVSDTVTIAWQLSTGADTYTVEVYQTDGMVLLNDYPDITGTFFSYTADMNAADCAAASATVKRDLTFKVYAVNDYGDSAASTLGSVINPSPVAVTGMSHSTVAVKWATKATAAGTILTDGNARATVTSASTVGGPHHINFAVTAGQSASTWAALARVAIAAHTDVAAKFVVSGTGTEIILTGKDGVFYDATLNVALLDHTCTGVTAAPTSADVSYNRYAVSWGPSESSGDLENYYVYTSATSGFTPGGGNLIYTGRALSVQANVTKASGAHPAQYWVVGVKDKWGTNIVLAAEQTIPSYP